MEKHVRVVKVVIASPGDLEEERNGIPQLFASWNNNNPEVHLHPLMWESGAVPTMGPHPQTSLNEQLVEKGELLVALFWSRLGTPTDKAESGTVEEIREFIRKKGPARVMVYFCQRPSPKGIDELDTEEIAKLQEFKKELQSICLWKQFESRHEFEGHLYRDLDAKVKQLLNDQLPTPEERKTGLVGGLWYDPDHPDMRLRQPIDFGNSLTEIAEGFSKRMDKFDHGDVIGKDKYMEMGVHVYRSVVQSLEDVLILRPDDASPTIKAKIQEVIVRLKSLADSKSLDKWPEFWEGGRQASDELIKHLDFEHGKKQ